MGDFGPFFFSLGTAGFVSILLTALFGYINERHARQQHQLAAKVPLHPAHYERAWGHAIRASATVGFIGTCGLLATIGVSSASVGAMMGYLMGMLFRGMMATPTPD